MSYALSAYLVTADEILQFPGCPDDELLAEVLEAAGESLANLDEQMCDPDDEDDISHEQAMRELFSGELTAEYYGARYGWAFDMLCNCLGTFLSNRGFSPCDTSWYEQLDEYLATSDVEFRFTQLIYDCPIELPTIDDWPCIGHWTQEQIAAAAPAMKKLAEETADREVAEALGTVNEWFEQALGEPGSMIVGFHG